MDNKEIKNRPSVSVAMAVYNGEKYIVAQINSILSQLSDCDELVISYDESTDQTYEIISEYAAKHSNVVIYNDPGKGVFSNFENAIACTTKDIVFISDQDDIWVEGKVTRVLGDFADEDIDMVIHNGVHIDSSNEIISQDFFSQYNIKKGIIRNYLKPRYSGCCMAFRKELIDTIIPIPRNVGAYDHWIGMIGECFGTVCFDNQVLLLHRLHGANVTVSTRDLQTILSARGNLIVEMCKRKKKMETDRVGK